MASLASNQMVSCINIPPKINSNGIWDNSESHPFFTHSFSLLQLQIIIIFFATQVCHMILKHLRIPTIVSQLLAGVILGPSVLGSFDKMKEVIFTVDSQDILGTIAALGYTLFIFLIGVKMDVSMVFKIGRMAFVIGLLNVVAPLLLGPSMENLFKKYWLGKYLPRNLYIIETSLAVSPFPDVYSLLTNLRILNSEIGRLALSAASISDLGTLLLINIVTFMRVAKDSSKQFALKCIGGTILYLMVVAIVIRRMMIWMIRQTPKGKPVKDIYINLITILVFVTAIVSNSIGQYSLFGPFILGLAIPDGPPLGSAIVERLDCIVSGILLPLFVTTSAMRAEFGALTNKYMLLTTILLICFTLLAKIVSCLIASLCCKMPFNDSLILALIMSCKGIVELATYSFSRDNRTIDAEIYAISFIAVMATITIMNILVAKLYGQSRKYAGYQKRNIMNLRPTSELRVLICIHSPDDITAAINFLDSSSPTVETPISVSVLHLIKLIGRASPIFISHNVQMRSATAYSYSENVIPPFNQYQRNNFRAVSVNIFTAISPSNFMHEDICTLALNRLTSLILLPFHISWCIDGSIASQDLSIRTLNINMLDRAPCSVGILVNRGQQRHARAKHIRHIAMIYLGGNDDREALSFSKRILISSSSNSCLTVVRLVPKNQKDTTTFDQMLDSNALKNVKHIEETVEDGPQTAYVLREMASQFDLFIIGRHYGIDWPQTKGLSQWSEFPELGVIGDLLASSDLNGQASILVVQQQTKIN